MYYYIYPYVYIYIITYKHRSTNTFIRIQTRICNLLSIYIYMYLVTFLNTTTYIIYTQTYVICLTPSGLLVHNHVWLYLMGATLLPECESEQQQLFGCHRTR